MNIGFIFGSAKISGGSYVILQHVEYLINKGYKVDLITLNNVSLSDADIWHPTLKKVNFVNINKATKKYDLVFATWWLSPFHLHKIDSKQYAYFVQSIEAYFFDDSQINSQFLAHSSYALGLPVITEATWIKKDLEDRFNSKVYLVKNGILKDIYTLEGQVKAPKKRKKLRCLVEGPLTSNFKNVARTIDALRSSKADEIWLLTSTSVDSVPNVDRVFSNVPITETAEIYRSCDVIIKQSIVEGMFGPPLEMFHCGGTAIVSNVTGHDEYIVDEKNAIVTPLNDWEAVIKAVNKLADNPKFLNELKENAIETAKNWPTWQVQSELFEAAVLNIMKLPPVSREELAYKVQHLLNQNELIKNSLSKYYIANPEIGASPSIAGNDGETLYRNQLAATIEEPTRLLQAPTSTFLVESKKQRQVARELLYSSEVSFVPRILGLSISNEHIEELWHPVIHKMGWEYKYICSRPQGYFKLYEDEELLNIDKDKYIIDIWYTNPSLLFKTIEEFKPNTILIHNGNHPAYQQILALIEERYGIPVVYSELGWFPQKKHIYFDKLGTNAKSNLARMSFEEMTELKAVKKKNSKPFSNNVKNIVLLVLQLENDTNFFEFCPHFNSNFEFIEYVINSLPENTELMIKAHPLDHNAHIYEVFQNKNISFVYDDINVLLPKVSSVIAINSTVLLEALDYQVNIYKCGGSILDNKELVIEFDNTNLDKVWEQNFIDNMSLRRAFKHRLMSYQINIGNESIEQLTDKHPSVKVIYESVNQFYLKSQQSLLEEKTQENDKITPKPGVRELPKRLNDIYIAIGKYKVISFDVFDTLIARNISVPSDIFRYVGQFACKLLNDPKFDHFQYRLEAEKACRQNISLVSGEVTYDEIYKLYLLRTGLPAHLVNKIKEYEIKAELQFLRPRKSAESLFNYAKETGKKVIILSDFYLGTDFIRTALEKCGYDLNGVELFVSCECGASKKDKKLYDYVATKLGMEKSSILHIGDNFAVDVQNALQCGVNSLHFPSANICLEHNSVLTNYLKLNNANYLGNRTLAHSVILGMMLNAIYDNPFNHKRNTIFNSSAKTLGLVALGPLVLTFTYWLMNKSKQQNVKELLFLARDGWLLKHAFDTLYEGEIKSFYLPASRKLMDNMSYSFDFTEVSKVLNSRFEGSTLSQLLKLKFNLQKNDVPLEAINKAGFTDLDISISLPADKIRVLKLLQQLREVIVSKAVETRELFTRYLKQQKISLNSSTALVDIGYFGSMQQSIQRFVKPNGEKLKGFYLATRAEVDFIEELADNTYGFITDKFHHTAAGFPNITRRLAYMEQLFSAPHPSVSSLTLDEGGLVVPQYYRHTGERAQHKVLTEIHKGVLEFIECYKQLSSQLEYDVLKAYNFPDYSEFIAHLINSGNNEYFDLLGGFILENRYNGQAAMSLPTIGAKSVSTPPANIPKAPVKTELTKSVSPSPVTKSVKTESIKTPQTRDTSIQKEKSKRERLYEKYKRNPYRFFKDSRNPFVRALSIFYKKDYS